MIAILAFGINSGAYVAEIIRGDILLMDNGQLEAKRSPGFCFVGVMFYIVPPQVFKNVLHVPGNAFIVLIEGDLHSFAFIKLLKKPKEEEGALPDRTGFKDRTNVYVSRLFSG